MKLIDTLLLTLSAGFFLIGLHQLYMVGFAHSYFLFMMMLACFLAFTYRKGKRVQEEEAQKTIENKKKPVPTPKKKKKRK